MLAKHNAASDTILRRKQRVLYADKVIQTTAFDNGLKQNIQLEGGGYVGAMTYTPHYYNMVGGALVTTEEERLSYIAGVPGSETVPGAPTNLVASMVGTTSATVTFTAGEEGSSPITNYEYSIDNGASWTAFSPIDTSSPVTISGLTASTAYQIKLRAINAVGTGAASDVLSVTTISLEAPILNLAVAGDTLAYIYFTAGAIAGGTTITNYEYSFDGGDSWTAFDPADTASPLKLTSLTNDTTYNVQLRAINSVSGPTPASGTLSVTPVAATPALPRLHYDPSDSSSYSGSGSIVSNIGSYGTLNGTLAGGVAYTGTGVVTPVFNFPGTAGAVISFPSYNFGTSITAIAWIYPRPTSTINGLLANATSGVQPNGFKFQWNTWTNDSRVIGMQAGNGTQGGDNFSVSNTIVYNEWQHVAYVFDQANRRVIFYRNGLPVDMQTSITPVANINVSAAFNIGGYRDGFYNMNAQLASIKVYNTLLNAAQIRADYDSTQARFFD